MTNRGTNTIQGWTVAFDLNGRSPTNGMPSAKSPFPPTHLQQQTWNGTIAPELPP